MNDNLVLYKMKVTYNNDNVKVCIIEFDDYDTQEFKDNLSLYNIGGRVYKITKEELEKLKKTNIKKVSVWKIAGDTIPKWALEPDDDSENVTYVYIDKLELELYKEYDNYEEFCRKLIKAEIKPQLPLYYYPSDTKEFAIKLIQEKVPSSFMYKEQLIDFVEYRECETYDLSKDLSMFSCLFDERRVLKFMPDMCLQAEINRIVIDIVRDLSIMF